MFLGEVEEEKDGVGQQEENQDQLGSTERRIT